MVKRENLLDEEEGRRNKRPTKGGRKDGRSEQPRYERLIQRRVRVQPSEANQVNGSGTGVVWVSNSRRSSREVIDLSTKTEGMAKTQC